jgi:hypothetical protein
MKKKTRQELARSISLALRTHEHQKRQSTVNHAAQSRLSKAFSAAIAEADGPVKEFLQKSKDDIWNVHVNETTWDMTKNLTRLAELLGVAKG